MPITITRPETVVEFCTDLALRAEHERAVAHLERVRKEQMRDAREVPADGAIEAAQAVRDIESQMREHTVLFTIRGLRRARWTAFIAANPPQDTQADKQVGLHVPALDEVIAESIVSVKTPDGTDVPLDPATEWMDLADEMTNGQWAEFATAVIQVNHEVRSAPFSPLASAVIRRSEQTSKPQND